MYSIPCKEYQHVTYYLISFLKSRGFLFSKIHLLLHLELKYHYATYYLISTV